MKKFLAILIALILVSGVMFADTLDLAASAPSIMKNGFSASAFTSYGAVISGAESLQAAIEKTVSFATMTGDVAAALTTNQDLGYYSIATNTKSSLGITVSAPALKSTALIDATHYYYVPYVLSFKHGTEDAISNTIHGSAGTEALSDASIELRADAYLSGGVYWKSYNVDLAFPDLTDGNGGLLVPAGNYEATVVITITTT